MGVIKRGILGGFSGKVGAIVGSSWKGIAVIKSLPLSVANPRTVPQVAQRNKFSGTVIFASMLLSNFIKPLWDRFASRMSGYNAFCQQNIDKYVIGADVPTLGFIVSQGKIPALRNQQFTPNYAAGTVLCEWDQAPQGAYESLDDKIMGYMYSDSDELIGFAPSTAIRSDGSMSIDLGGVLREPNNLSGCIVALSADGYNAGADLSKLIG